MGASTEKVVGYRAPRKPHDQKKWRDWVFRNQDALGRIGIPLFVYHSAEGWWWFLQDGYARDPEHFFGVHELSKGQCLQFLAFLERDAGESGDAHGLVQALHADLGWL